MKKANKKAVFVFNIHSVIDIITNSSSELFVFNCKTEEILKDMITNVYPEYTKEYEEPKLLCLLSNEELDSYMGWAYRTYGKANEVEIFRGYTFDEMYECRTYGSGKYEQTYYKLKDDFIEKNRTKLLEFFDPENSTWLLYSIDENPNWDYQEKLSEIGTRYHLG